MKLITLKSGVRAVLAPCEAESVAFGIFIASGSRHESAERAGISHFIEHMLFKGTPTRRPIDITRAIEGRGGNFNAYTSEESTCFFTHLPCEYLAEAIDILSDMYLNASIENDEFERERSVIFEEIRMYRDEPDSVAAENLQRAIFPRCPLGAPVAGSFGSLAPLTPADMKKYIKTHYLPSNTILVITGAFEPDDASKLLEDAFPRGFRRDTPFSAVPVNFALPPNASVSEDKDVSQTQLALGFRTFGIRDERKYAASVLDAIMGRGMSSRLFQQLREKRGLSYDISSRWQFFSDAGMFAIAAGLDPAKADKALAVINREIDRIATKKVSKSELERTKEFLIGNFRLSHEKVLSKMLFYGSTMLAFNRLVTTQEQVEGIRAVTPEDILAVAQDVLRPENRSISWVVPKSR